MVITSSLVVREVENKVETGKPVVWFFATSYSVVMTNVLRRFATVHE